MSCPSRFSRFYHPQNSGWAVQIIELLNMKVSPHPCYIVPLRLKHSPQHPILKHTQYTFLPKCNVRYVSHILEATNALRWSTGIAPLCF
jgi:hypothetical protein